jgi:uncharacterized protein
VTTSSFSSRAERPHALRTLAVLAIVGSTALAGCSSGHESRSNTRTHQSPPVTSTTASNGAATVYVPGTTDREPFSYDEATPLHATERQVAMTGSYRAFRLTYRSVDQTVPAYLSVPTRPAARAVCLVIQHGLHGSKEDGRGFWDPLAQQGATTLAIDARFHGERGSASELERVLSDARSLRTMLQGTVIDLRRGIDVLQQRPECADARIGYVGFSMGGVLGALLAGSDTRVQAPVLVVAGGDWRTLLRDPRNPWLPAGVIGPAHLNESVHVLDPIDPVHCVGRISPRPVLMVNGDADEVIPVAAADALHNAAREPKQVEWYHGGHSPQGIETVMQLAVVSAWLGKYFT